MSNELQQGDILKIEHIKHPVLIVSKNVQLIPAQTLIHKKKSSISFSPMLLSPFFSLFPHPRNQAL